MFVVFLLSTLFLAVFSASPVSAQTDTSIFQIPVNILPIIPKQPSVPSAISQPENNDRLYRCLAFRYGKDPKTGECRRFECTDEGWNTVEDCTPEDEGRTKEPDAPIATSQPVSREIEIPLKISLPQPATLEGKIIQGSRVVGGTREFRIPAQLEPAVDNVFNEGRIDKIRDQVRERISLVESKKETLFEIPGVKQKRFFGIFPVSIQKTVLVGENGRVIGEEKTFFNRILDLFSF